MKKALITASVFGFIGSFEKSNIQILLDKGYEVHVATNMSKDLKAFGDTGQLDGINIIKHQISYNRSPLSLQTINSYKAIKKLIQEENFDLIHCHTPVVSILTRLVARNFRKKGTKVIYTAHGFHFFKGAPFLSWLIYFPVEYICSFFTDILITINQEDYHLAKKVMKAKKIEYIPGVGIDVDKYKNVSVDKKSKRKELGVPEDEVMLLSVGELSHRKNHQVVISALKELNNENIHYCIVGQGSLEKQLRNMVNNLGLEQQVHFLGFRSDVNELCKIADIFVFPSLQEGLPVALMEAMAAGLPVVCSNIRGNRDLINDSEGGYLINPKDIGNFMQAINNIILNKSLRSEFSKFNMNRIKRYGSDNIMDKMEMIYQIEDCL